MDKRKHIKTLLLALILLTAAASVSAEDKLRPVFKGVYNSIKGVVDKTIGIFHAMFPGLTDSVYSLFFGESENESLAWVTNLRPLLWLVYIASFIVIIIFLYELWNISRKYLYNTISGVLIMLACIHLFGVETGFTVLNTLLIILLGVPGAIIVLLFYYLGVSI